LALPIFTPRRRATYVAMEATIIDAEDQRPNGTIRLTLADPYQ
jgi:hypothetical protein